MVEIHDHHELIARIDAHRSLADTAIQGIHLTPELESQLKQVPLHGAFFLGCQMSRDFEHHLIDAAAFVLKSHPQLPFNPFRPHLYQPKEIFAGFDPADPLSYCDCFDARIYHHWKENGAATPPSIIEGIFQRLHDQSISDAVDEFIAKLRRPVVAIMGGHSVGRDSKVYRQVAEISRELTRREFLMISGGGPGAMEATHLGALLAHFPDAELSRAIDSLSTAPGYQDLHWLTKAFDLLNSLDPSISRAPSLGIPTWLYGHEPPTPFATHIAKYFNNSLREEGLITLAHDGIIFSPGSAGTIQEIFQDAAQNHYATTGFASPMIFLDRHYWTVEKPVYPLLTHLAGERDYSQVLKLSDDPAEVVELIVNLEKIPTTEKTWEFCEAHGRLSP